MTDIDFDLVSHVQFKPLLDTVRILKISDEEYFSDKYKDYISNSRLGLLNPEQGGSPGRFFGKTFCEFTSSLELGSIVHELCLQKEYYTLVEDVDKPTGKVGMMADFMYDKYKETGDEPYKFLEDAIRYADYYHGIVSQKAKDKVLDSCQEYWDKREEYEIYDDKTTTLIYTDSKTREKANGCLNSLYLNYDIQSLLYPEGISQTPFSENEYAILVDMEMTVPGYDPFVFNLKSKLDNYSIDNEKKTITVNDIKTIGKHISCFNENIKKYSYYRELAFYLNLLSYTGSYSGYDKEANFLVVSTIPPHQTRIVRMTGDDIDNGWKEAEYLLKLAAVYYSNGYRFE